MTWTAEDSQRLQEAHDQLLGKRIVSFSADLEIGNLLLPAFNANVDRFDALGLYFSARECITVPFKVCYRGFTVTGPQMLMDQFQEWYRGFFRI